MAAPLTPTIIHDISTYPALCTNNLCSQKHVQNSGMHQGVVYVQLTGLGSTSLIWDDPDLLVVTFHKNGHMLSNDTMRNSPEFTETYQALEQVFVKKGIRNSTYQQLLGKVQVSFNKLAEQASQERQNWDPSVQDGSSSEDNLWL